MPDGELFECPADISILNAAHAAGILIPYSCRSGQCRSRRGRVLCGDITYPGGLPDAIGDAETEVGQVLFCIAYAGSDLVIEILKPEF
ncbi:MAG: 2Fe-2S iron-sulfur cluster binding domain-containing protein [Gammaproteobacteria bacterium]|nr:2Fe-2S iron-sulfur cluster binding domain-containing protein [Gammaproteobacteria bacterium]